MDTARQLIDTLIRTGAFGHDTAGTRLIETHTAWIILSGDFAWKIKKPVNFGFLDYSTLEKRHFFCNEELRLNRRFAPQVYLEVIAITGSASSPRLGGNGPVLEYAVHMRRFAEGGLLSELAGQGKLETGHIDQMIERVADFHRDAEVAPADTLYGGADRIYHWVSENFRHIRPLLTAAAEIEQLETVRHWTEAEHGRLEPLMQRRKQQGAIRECHGDLHLGNITLIENRVTLFDCIEFNPELRWIDLFSEVAFLVMDLVDHAYPQYAFRFLNGYLQHTGDYAGLDLLRYYLVYRALVRAKVALLRKQQAGADQAAAHAGYLQYLQLAQQGARRGRPALLITYGVSGSGKSTLAAKLCEAGGLLQLRSDIERKRMAGLEAGAHSASAPGQGLYTADRTEQTYRRLEELAATVIEAGYAVIVDATFLQRRQRDRFRALAQRCRVPFLILACHAADPEIERRVRSRAERGGDASEATLEVLQQQRRVGEALAPDELPCAIDLVDDRIQPALDALAKLPGGGGTGVARGDYF